MDRITPRLQLRFLHHLLALCSRFASRWLPYWGAPGGQYSLAICRIAVALSLYLSFPGYIQDDYAHYMNMQNAAVYVPDGILNLFGSTLLPSAYFEFIKTVAKLSTLTMLLGLFSRLSTLVSLFSNLCLASLIYSFMPAWSHGYNVIFLAQLAILFGRSGDCLSIDAILHAWRHPGKNEALPAFPYRLGVLLGQAMVALMFFNAAFYKLHADHFHLGWAFSDNLRHWLVLQYYLLAQSPPPLVEWILAHEWNYKAVAIGTLVSQSMPVVACLLSPWPMMRAFCGMFFVLETLGLGVVMGLWNPQWLPLYAFFIDWERGLAWLGARLGRTRYRLRGDGSPVCWADATPSPAITSRPWLYGALYIAYTVSLIGYESYVAFTMPDLRNKTYPFTAFPMYSAILAKRPLHVHQTFEIIYADYSLHGSALESRQIEHFVKANYSWLVYNNDMATMRQHLQVIPSTVAAVFPPARIDRVALKRAIYEIPPYPAHSRPVVRHQGLMGIWDRDKGFTGVVALHRWDTASQRPYLEVSWSGLAHPEFRLGYVLNLTEPPKLLEIQRDQDRLYYHPRERGSYFFLLYVTDPQLGSEEHVFAGPIN